MRKAAEVVVVGGGIIGCAVASELADLGADVILLERSELAHGASGRNHGLLFYPQDPVTDPLYRKSLEIYRALLDRSPIDIALDDKPRGFIVLVAKEEEWEPAEREARVCEAGGVKVQKMSADELRAAEPNVARHYLGGWHIDDGFRLDPASLTLAMATEARRRGAEVATHVDVKQVIAEKGKVVGVASDQGVIEAKSVVDAAGPWAPKLARSAGVDLEIVGARGWLLLTAAIDRFTDHLLESSGWHLTAGDPGPEPVTVGGYARGEHPSAAQVGMLIQQNRTGHVLLGGSRLSSTREDPEGHEVTLEIARRAAEAVPLLSEVPVIAVWSGVRPMSPDGRPLIGPVDGVEGLWVCGGHGGQGVMLGSGSARLLAEMLTANQTFTSAQPFDPIRFNVPGGRASAGHSSGGTT